MTPRRKRRDLLGRLSLLYLAGILLLAGIQAIVGDRHWLAVPLVYAPKAPLLLPLLLLGLIALAARSWRMLAVNAASAGVCALWLMHFVLPIPRFESAPSGRPLTVMTFNIHFGAAGVPAVARAIRAAAPDIALLQEVKAGPGFSDPSPALRRTLSRPDAFGVVRGGSPDRHLVHRGEYLIASRFPLREARELSLGAGHRTLLAVEAALGERRITLCNVHFATALHGQALARRRGSLPQYLAHAGAVRQSQATALQRHLSGLRGPVLLAGDFNCPPGSHALRRLDARLIDTFAAAGGGFGFTFPSHLPLLRIDYLFASRDFAVRGCHVLRTGASDHCAIVADLVLLR